MYIYIYLNMGELSSQIYVNKHIDMLAAQINFGMPVLSHMFDNIRTTFNTANRFLCNVD